MRKLFKYLIVPIISISAIIVIAVFIYYENNTPEAEYYVHLINSIYSDSPTSLKIIDRNNVIHNVFEGNIYVPADSFNQKHVRWLIAREDKTFNSKFNFGFAFFSLLKAFYESKIQKSYNRGGSTITMQLIRILSQRTEISTDRKMAEVVQSLKLYSTLSKKTILECYLNLVPVAGVTGFPRAAKKYFNKTCKDLSDSEFLLLCASLPGNKHIYSRYDIYAKKLYEEGLINLFEYENIINNKPALSVAPRNENISLFSPVVINILKENSDITAKEVHTSISFLLQDSLQSVIQKYLTRFNRADAVKTSFVIAEASSMEIYCYINTDALIPLEYDLIKSNGSQPYSRIKPFLYALYLDKLSNSNYYNVKLPTNYDTYNVSDFRFNSRYSCSINEALSKSLNSPAKYIICEKVGLDRFKSSLVLCNFINDTTTLYTPAALGAFNISELNLLNLMRISLYNGKAMLPKFTSGSNVIEETSIVKPKTAKIIRSALEEAVINGTSRGLKGLDTLGFKIWNKTGSADEGNGVGCSGLFEYKNQYFLYSLRLESKNKNVLPFASNDAIPLLKRIMTKISDLRILLK